MFSDLTAAGCSGNNTNAIDVCIHTLQIPYRPFSAVYIGDDDENINYCDPSFKVEA